MDFKIILRLISLIIILIGVIMVYDARRISKKWFSYSDKNSIARMLKVFGFIASILGCFIIIINMY